MPQQAKQGELIHADYFNNVGGLNITDSPFRVGDGQATGGYNYNYTLVGGFRKRKGHDKVNSTAFTQLRTSGVFQHITSTGTKTTIATMDRKINAINLTTPSATPVTEDTTAAGSDFLQASNTVQTLGSQFNTTSANTLWLIGGGMTLPVGVYSSTKATVNGAAAPTGTIVPTAGGAGSTLQTGTYWYAIVSRKGSTLVTSNASLDASVAVTAGQQVTIDLTGVVTGDNAKYDQIWIYRSGLNGVTGFTTGDLIAQLASGTASYVDTGTFITSATNVPRAGNLILDNSTLTSGAYKGITTYKRRLVVAKDSTIYFSDLNKPESWPLANFITVPSGGNITGLAIISLTSATSREIDEVLVIYKDEEIWAVTGTTPSDFVLKYISNNGTPLQNVVVPANGFLSWMNLKGVYTWDGSGKPIRLSRPIDTLFKIDGDIDRSKFSFFWGSFYELNQEVVWYISDVNIGEQKAALRLDLRLTTPALTGSELASREIDGVFMRDSIPMALYAGASKVYTGSDEMLLSGDASGFLYDLYSALSDEGAGIDFSYSSKYHDLGSVGIAKRIHKVIVWVEDTSDEKLTLSIWPAYQSSEQDAIMAEETISRSVSQGIWDLGYWDAAEWDNALLSTFTPVVFNPKQAEGDAFRLRFSQTEADAPTSVAGYTIIYSEIGLRK